MFSRNTLFYKYALAITLPIGALVACSSDSSPTPVAPVAKCGDGKIDAPEICDDGVANGTPKHCKADCAGMPKVVSVEGDVLAFLTEVSGPRIGGIKVSVLEHPEMVVTAGADDHFKFDGLEEGQPITLLAEHSTFRATQTARLTLGPNGIFPFPIQVVPNDLFSIIQTLLPLDPELDKYCAIATTVARMGSSLYVHLRQGMPGVTVTLNPPVPKESGPIYFNEQVQPDSSKTATSIDGGALFYRIPPGNYELISSKAGTVFNIVHLQCRVGVIVNAGPPMGPEANVKNPDHGKGLNRPADAYSASSDALCGSMQRCYNEQAKTTTNYPDTMLASCKAMFRNTWSFVEEKCDAASGVRDAAKAFYTCRAQDCDHSLTDDTSCVAEEATFRSAETAYGSCLTSP